MFPPSIEIIIGFKFYPLNTALRTNGLTYVIPSVLNALAGLCKATSVASFYV